ncbi:hypothetical protein ACTFIZ_003852 [Dictyostelium cf. discoideum]
MIKRNDNDNVPIKSISPKKELEPKEKLTIFYPKTPCRGKVKISYDNQYLSSQDLIRIYPKSDLKNNNYVYYNPIKKNNNNNKSDIVSNCIDTLKGELTSSSLMNSDNTTISTITTATTTPPNNINSIGNQSYQSTSINETQVTTSLKTMRFEVNLKSSNGEVDYKELVKKYIQSKD